jgi:putative tryptophan/tyrosine transport system permease protein
MLLLIASLTIGLILSLLALGSFISFRVFDFPDITTEGSFTLGGAIAATLLVAGVDPLVATSSAIVGGLVAGTITGVVHTRFRIDRLLSGIIVMTALFSINLHVMGRANVPLLTERSLASAIEGAGRAVVGEGVMLAGWVVSARELAMLVAAFAAAVVVGTVLYLFFRTNLGTAMQAAGDNADMIRALGVSVPGMIVFGLALANGLSALAGALLTQYQGFADVQMGIGMLVWALASIIIGEALVGTRHIGYLIVGAVMGSVLFRLLVAVALRGGLDPNDLKLVTAVFVLGALILPKLIVSRRRRPRRPAPAAAA